MRDLFRVLVMLVVGAIVPAAWAADLEGVWHGAIEVPGTPLTIELEFDSAGGVISIPVQGLKDVALKNVSQDGDRVEFEIVGIPGNPLFQGEIVAEEISGTFTQHGTQLLFAVSRGDPTESVRQALRALDEIGPKAVTDFNVPGAAIAVVYKGEVVYSSGFGMRDIDSGKPMTADTLFAVGSTTKAMTTTVMGMLVDEGKLDWDAPVRDYLPYFKLSDPAITDAITVRDLVTHRSGMPRHDALWYNFNEGTREALIRRFGDLELTAGLRERFQYNNLMYMTAGHIGASVAGAESWEALMRERLFEPLGMSRSNLSVLASQRDDDHALPYRRDDEDLVEIELRQIDLVGPAGSVNSSVNEMAEWIKLNLNSGSVGDRQLVSQSALRDIQSHHMPSDRGPPDPLVTQGVYGLGWFIGTYRGHRQVYHGGGIDGFITSVVLFPNDELGMVSFTNTGLGLGQWLNLTAADIVLGYEDRKWLDEALARQNAASETPEGDEDDPRRKTGTKPTHGLAQYAGAYFHPSYGDLSVALDRRKLTMTFNDLSGPLEHWHYNVWQVDPEDPSLAMGGTKVQFGVGMNGEIASVSARLEPTGQPIVFLKKPDAKLSDASYLSNFTGNYETATGQRIVVDLRGSELHMTVGQQPTRRLNPALGERFSLETVGGVEVQFDDESVLLIQPNGVFRGTRTAD